MRRHLRLATIARGSSGEWGGEKSVSSVFEHVDPLTVSYAPENNVFVQLIRLTRLHQYETTPGWEFLLHVSYLEIYNEGSYINKSLLTLGTVIGKLSEGKASHIPYRYSKLTHLLQSSLNGRGHVLLICTVIPASSSTEETHNTLKFASRSKRVEIYASRNKIIDEKSLIKKYQREISSLKQELDQLRRGMLAGISHEEIKSLRQQLEEGQVKMQSRLEEEEEAKAALMSRIQ
ncbi:Kinesin-like protein KIN-7D, mitochondrial [Ancistrocladus abbreviatus]